MKKDLIGTFSALLLLTAGCHGQPQTKDANRSSVDLQAEIAHTRDQLKVSPNSSELHEQLSVLGAMESDWSTFEKENALAIKFNPKNVTNYFEAAEVYRRRHLTRKAFETMRSALAVDPDNPLSHFLLGNLYDEIHDREKATAEYSETKRLVDALKSPQRSEANRIDSNKYYDRFGNTYMLDILDGKLGIHLHTLGTQAIPSPGQQRRHSL